MNRLGLVVFLFIQMWVITTLSGQELSEQVLSIHNQKFRWMEQLQLDSLKAMLDDQVIYIHSNGWRETKDDIITHLETGYLAYHKITVMDARVRIYGHTGIVNGKGKFDVSLKGKPIEIFLDYTEVYLFSHDQWKLVSRHSCRFEN